MSDVTKSESDGQHPAGHYLVADDPQSPSTWHLRVKGADGKPDHGLMGAAWAALHGGYRGDKYEGPAKDDAVKKLKGMYDSEKMATPGEASRKTPGEGLDGAHGKMTGKPSIGSLSQHVNKAIAGDKRFQSDDGRDGYCQDILTPDDDGGMDAIVRTGNGDMVKHGFSWDGSDVTMDDGDPEPVDCTPVYASKPESQRKGAEEEKAPAGLNADQVRKADGKFHGAAAATKEAYEASDGAETKDDHDKAAVLHEKAADLQKAAGNEAMAKIHKEKATFHKDHANALTAGNVNVGSNGTLADARGSALEGAFVERAPVKFDAFMVMPAGIHQVTLGRLGQPHTIVVNVDEAGARARQAQLEAVNASCKLKAFNCFDHQKTAASSHPKKYWWENGSTAGRPAGIYESAEPTSAGLDAVGGQVYQGWSETFYVDNEFATAENPAQIINPLENPMEADGTKKDPNDFRVMGTLTNRPAFTRNEPLFAGNVPARTAADAAAGTKGTEGTKEATISSSAKSAATANGGGISIKTTKHMKTETLDAAALATRNEQLEGRIAELTAKDDAVSKAELRASKAELDANLVKLELAKSQEKVTSLEASETDRKKTAAKDAVKVMINNQDIAALDAESQQDWEKRFIADPSLIALVAKPKNGAGRITPSATVLEAGRQAGQVSSGFSAPGSMKRLLEILNANARVRVTGSMSKAEKIAAYETKGKLALEAGLFYKRELAKNISEWDQIPNYELAKCVGLDASAAQRPSRAALEAADYVDPNNQLGTLSGTLVLQRTLPLFALEYPELMSMYTDFSDAPGLLNQTEQTRIVIVPAVQKYDSTKDAAGRPKGWDTVSPAQTIDAPLTLTDYIAVPIVFGQDILSETTRQLFSEQSAGGIKAIAGYFTQMMTALITPANFNSYAAVTNDNPQSVPVAYAYYVKGLQDWSMADLDKLSAIMTQNRVPKSDRGVLLSTQYYAKLRSDPRLEFFFAAAQGNPILMEQKLPAGLSGFFPYEAAYLPSTNNLAFFVFHKAAIILKSRLPLDFKNALDVMIPGSVTTVTDPDTKISVALVQYVNLTQNYAEWRPEVQLGAAKGDARGGLCGTSQ